MVPLLSIYNLLESISVCHTNKYVKKKKKRNFIGINE